MIPGGSWALKTSLNLSSNSTELNQSFSTTHLVIKTTCKDCKATWHKAGYLYQFFEIPLIGKAEFQPRFLIILNKLTVVRLNTVKPTYKLRFEMEPWITSLNLQIYEPSVSIES
ncbi:hypothetical protein [Nostoc sp. NMS9]|uniref:hypothetical protein n=1 Tax=Nostoc sp. NMS9 TaxID=2815393 RepID=UPI0025CD0CE4|nr:hypothetical protein [Nostoc sp. NMS9]MBN3944116.1 hypothetical protein [Nostoc sp. NMS9]